MSSKLDAFNYNHALIDITPFRYAKAPDVRPKREMPRGEGPGLSRGGDWLVPTPGRHSVGSAGSVFPLSPPAALEGRFVVIPILQMKSLRF